MELIYAPDSYGGFLSAAEACEEFESVLASQGLFATSHPMSDGGEGLLQTLIAHTTMELNGLSVDGADGTPVFTSAARWNGSWWLESGQALGAIGTEETPSPFQRSSTGLGQLMMAACARAPGPLVVGLGGSKTIDGGAGALRALGLHLLDSNGRDIGPRPTAADLSRIATIEGHPPLSDRVIRILCDVRTTLVDSTVRFGPQKGVKQPEIDSHTESLMQWADVLNTWRRTHGREALALDSVGGGAAGGMGFALAAIGGHCTDGASVVARLTGLDTAVQGKTLVVIGEGRLDRTSFDGKVAGTVIQAARRHGAKVVALVGSAQPVPSAPEGPDEIIEIGGTTLAAFRASILELCKRLD